MDLWQGISYALAMLSALPLVLCIVHDVRQWGRERREKAVKYSFTVWEVRPISTRLPGGAITGIAPDDDEPTVIT